jgi:hypothetical protein
MFHFAGLSFMVATLDRPPAGLSGQAGGDLVEPVAHGIAPANFGRLAGQYQEGSLEYVLGIMPVPQDAPAHAPHQRSVALDQHSEGGIVMLGDETLEELSIGRFGRRLASQAAEVADDAL